jgi:hypothetical protein
MYDERPDPVRVCIVTRFIEMIFLKDRTIAANWLSDNPDNREIFTLEEAIDFASLFFKVTGQLENCTVMLTYIIQN